MASPRSRTLALILSFCLAIGATFFFGYRAGRTARHIRTQNEPIKPWMSVPFVAHTYHAREKLLFDALGVPANPRDRRPLRDIAREEKVPVTKLIRELQDAIAKGGPEGGKTP